MEKANCQQAEMDMGRKCQQIDLAGALPYNESKPISSRIEGKIHSQQELQVSLEQVAQGIRNNSQLNLDYDQAQRQISQIQDRYISKVISRSKQDTRDLQNKRVNNNFIGPNRDDKETRQDLKEAFFGTEKPKKYQDCCEPQKISKTLVKYFILVQKVKKFRTLKYFYKQEKRYSIIQGKWQNISGLTNLTYHITINNILYALRAGQSPAYIKPLYFYKLRFQDIRETKLEVTSLKRMYIDMERLLLCGKYPIIISVGGTKGSSNQDFTTLYSILANNWKDLPQLKKPERTQGLVLFQSNTLYSFYQRNLILMIQRHHIQMSNQWEILKIQNTIAIFSAITAVEYSNTVVIFGSLNYKGQMILLNQDGELLREIKGTKNSLVPLDVTSEMCFFQKEKIIVYGNIWENFRGTTLKTTISLFDGQKWWNEQKTYSELKGHGFGGPKHLNFK